MSANLVSGLNPAETIIIIESPNKIKSYEKYVGIQTMASVGHYRGLPKGQMGINLDINSDKVYNPNFIVEEGKKRVYNDLMYKCKNKNVVIATDDDREGDAIAYFIYKDVKAISKTVYRISVKEITEKGILKGINEKIPFEEVDKNSYFSFFGRRLTDRMVGYIASSDANDKLNMGLSKQNYYKWSVGRVQTAAVYLVKAREDEIKVFKDKPKSEKVFWTISAVFEHEGQKAVALHEKDRFDNLGEVEALVSSLKGKTGTVVGVRKKSSTTSAPFPYDSSALVQDASSRLGLSTKKTMDAAQELFEAGGITYHRTDSYSISKEFIEEIRERIKELYGESELPSSANHHSNPKSQAEAHEAIRPTSFEFSTSSLSSNAKALYDLIVQRTLASQMLSIKFSNSTLSIDVNGEKFIIKQKVIDENGDGYLLAYPRTSKDKEIYLPSMQEGDSVDFSDIFKLEKMKNAPARYTEATLVAKLESEGIGRPSTYASIMTNITGRSYIEEKLPSSGGKKKVFHCTSTGHRLIDEYCKPHMPWIIDLKMTVEMEGKLDQIAKGKLHWKDFLRSIHEKFNFSSPKTKEMKVVEGVACSICGGDIVENDAVFTCKNYVYNKTKGCSTDCQFVVWKDNKIVKRILTKEDLINLTDSKELVSEDGSILILNQSLIIQCKEHKYINRDKESFLIRPKKYIEFDCPVENCGGRLIEKEKSYCCEHHKKFKKNDKWILKGCKLSIPKTNEMLGINDLPHDDLARLLNNETVVSQKDKKCKIDLSNEWILVEEKNYIPVDCKCPLCGSGLEDRAGYFTCSTNEYKNKKTVGCKFSVKKTNDYLGFELDVSLLKELVEDNKTIKTEKNKNVKFDKNEDYFIVEEKNYNFIDIDCPKCKKRLHEITTSNGHKMIKCEGEKYSNRKNIGCDFKIMMYNKIISKELSTNDVRKLVNNEVVKYSDIGIVLDLGKEWCVAQSQ